MNRKEPNRQQLFRLAIHGWAFADTRGLESRIRQAEKFTDLSAGEAITLEKMREALSKEREIK